MEGQERTNTARCASPSFTLAGISNDVPRRMDGIGDAAEPSGFAQLLGVQKEWDGLETDIVSTRVLKTARSTDLVDSCETDVVMARDDGNQSCWTCFWKSRTPLDWLQHKRGQLDVFDRCSKGSPSKECAGMQSLPRQSKLVCGDASRYV